MSESGRAITAYHAVTVVDIIGLIDTTHTKYSVELTGQEPQVLKELAYTRDNISVKNFAEMYHDAITQKDELLTLFNLGYLSLDDRAKGEIVFWEVCRKLSRILSYKSLKYIPEEFQDLNKSLADKLIANFSVFQSMPDHLGHRPALPGDAHPPAEGEADPLHHPLRHHLRLRRQDGQVHRPEGCPRRDPAPRAPARGTLLPGLLPHGGLPGHPGHAPQPLRHASPRPTWWSRTTRTSASSRSCPPRPWMTSCAASTTIPTSWWRARPSKRRTSAQADAVEALRALLTEQRKLHTYLDMH